MAAIVAIKFSLVAVSLTNWNKFNNSYKLVNVEMPTIKMFQLQWVN